MSTQLVALKPIRRKEVMIDLTYLNTISKGKESFIQEMLRISLLEFPNNMEILDSAIATNDLEKARAVAHKFKAGCTMFGAKSLLRLASKIEDADSIEEIEEHSAIFSEKLNKVMETLKKLQSN